MFAQVGPSRGSIVSAGNSLAEIDTTRSLQVCRPTILGLRRSASAGEPERGARAGRPLISVTPSPSVGANDPPFERTDRTWSFKSSTFAFEFIGLSPVGTERSRTYVNSATDTFMQSTFVPQSAAALHHSATRTFEQSLRRSEESSLSQHPGSRPRRALSRRQTTAPTGSSPPLLIAVQELVQSSYRE